jgi:predicted acyl esterase
LWLTTWLKHQRRDGYWKHGSICEDFSRVKCPVYAVSGWADGYSNAVFRMLHHLDVPKKGLVGPWGHKYPHLGSPGPAIGFLQEALRWWDHWLKGIDTGIMDEPPISLFVQGINQWRYAHEWPLPETKWTKFYLRENGQLSEESPSGDEKQDRFFNRPWLKPGEEVPSIKFSTPVLTEDCEITGPSALYLYASLSGPDADWMVEIRDVDESGKEKLVTMGWLKASHRELDEEKSLPYQPYHSHTRREELTPGKIYEYAVEIREASMVFRAGHKIELVIKGQDAPWEGKEYFRDVFWHLPRRTETEHTIYHSPGFASYVLLPVIPK